MNITLTQEYKQFLLDSELGINSLKFIEIVDSIGNNKKFIDLGVETGKSSMIFLNNAIERNNKVWGIDPIPNMTQEILDNPQYIYLKDDSVRVGLNWLVGSVDIVFVDSIHAKEQVLSELYAWWDHINEGGWIIFHDTAWEGYIHKPNHPCAGKLTGNTGKGYDFYGGIAWETPDKAVKQFFNLDDSLNKDDEFITSIHCPLDLGMTFVKKKKHFDYKQNVSNWNEIFTRRNHLLQSF